MGGSKHGRSGPGAARVWGEGGQGHASRPALPQAAQHAKSRQFKPSAWDGLSPSWPWGAVPASCGAAVQTPPPLTALGCRSRPKLPWAAWSARSAPARRGPCGTHPCGGRRGGVGRTACFHASCCLRAGQGLRAARPCVVLASQGGRRLHAKSHDGLMCAIRPCSALRVWPHHVGARALVKHWLHVRARKGKRGREWRGAPSALFRFYWQAGGRSQKACRRSPCPVRPPAAAAWRTWAP